MEAVKENERIVKAKRLETSDEYTEGETYLIKVSKPESGIPFIEVSLASNGKNLIPYNSEEEYLAFWEELEEQKQETERHFILEIVYEGESPRLKIANNGVLYTDIIALLEVAKSQHVDSLIGQGN